MRANMFNETFYQPGDDWSADANVIDLIIDTEWDRFSTAPFYAHVFNDEDGDCNWCAEVLDNESGETLCYLENFESREQIEGALLGAYPSMEVQ